MKSERRNLVVFLGLFAAAMGIALAFYGAGQTAQTNEAASNFELPNDQLANRIKSMAEEQEEFPETTLTDDNVRIIQRIRNAVRMPFDESVLGACTETTTTVGFQRPEGYYDVFSGRRVSNAAVYEMTEAARSTEVLPCLLHLATIAASLHTVPDWELMKSVAREPRFQAAFDNAIKGGGVDETWQCGSLEMRLVSVVLGSEPNQRSIRIELHSKVSNGEYPD